ncbi:uncharacterized protein TNCV_1115361 [Trichonephila clavipes]|nr:uncharacterized protein TNCV_1115361 [Trichonephila clavipes]
MGKKRDLSPCKKAEVKALVNAKLFSNREISRRLKVSEASGLTWASWWGGRSCFTRKPKLTPAMKSKRLNWTKQWCDKYVDFWRSTVKNLTKIMIWSIISGKDTGRLYVVKGMMRQDQYNDVLQNHLILQLEEWFPNSEPHIFMQDGISLPYSSVYQSFFGRAKYPSVGLAG